MNSLFVLPMTLLLLTNNVHSNDLDTINAYNCNATEQIINIILQ